MKPYNILTYPYFQILKLRHRLYDNGIKKSYKTKIPSIGLGNITVGGTGKTPHAEMLIRLLMNEYKIAFISRGYGRKSKGLKEVEINDSAKMSGDEALQVKRKFPNIRVIISESRLKAVEMLENETENTRPNLIIFDDIFQHRKITPTISILLIDYNRPSYDDSLLPFGNLRDIPSQSKRADIVIITKIPNSYIPTLIEIAEFRKRIDMNPNQKLYFSSIIYSNPKAIFEKEIESRYLYSKNAIYFSGIANDYLFKTKIGGDYKILGGFKFKDHKIFSTKNIRQINSLAMKHPETAIFTTEKDAQRLFSCNIPTKLKTRLFQIPIEVEIGYDELNYKSSPMFFKKEIISMLDFS